jgi:hypothetical protein
MDGWMDGECDCRFVSYECEDSRSYNWLKHGRGSRPRISDNAYVWCEADELGDVGYVARSVDAGCC